MLDPIFIERDDIPGSSIYHKPTSEEKKYISFYSDKVVQITRDKAASIARLKVYITDLDLYDFEGSVENAISMLQTYKELPYDEVVLSVYYGYDYEGNNKNTLNVYGYRNETEEETLARVAYEKEKKAKERAENKATKDKALAKEQAEYERLKKKFEKGEE